MLGYGISYIEIVINGRLHCSRRKRRPGKRTEGGRCFFRRWCSEFVMVIWFFAKKTKITPVSEVCFSFIFFCGAFRSSGLSLLWDAPCAWHFGNARLRGSLNGGKHWHPALITQKIPELYYHRATVCVTSIMLLLYRKGQLALKTWFYFSRFFLVIGSPVTTRGPNGSVPPWFPSLTAAQE